MTRPRHAPGESSQRCDAPLGLKQEVAGVSFSGQQHGSVYWSGGAEALLRAGGAPEEPVAAELLSAHAPPGQAPRGLEGGLREGPRGVFRRA